MPLNIELVIFDCDGLLVDSEVRMGMNAGSGRAIE
jgi:3-deoxy-D-manno-octulosonate 8-phosphate phosphatase KdsC-like HAD superfamily phosphatase